MRTLVAVVVVLCVQSTATSQEVGSAAAFDVVAGIANAAMDREARWNVAKKLSVQPIPLGLQPPNDYDLDLDNLTEGKVGKMDYWDFKVLSVVDSQNTLLQLGTNRTFWLEQFPSKDLVDGQSVRLIGPVQVMGTRDYTSAIGASRTVRVLRFVPKEKIEQAEKEAAERELAAEKAKEDALYRTWHSKAGTKVVAQFIAWRAGNVELLTKDGRKLYVDIDAFTKADADALRELNRELRAKK